jgi:hypothetical protein
MPSIYQLQMSTTEHSSTCHYKSFRLLANVLVQIADKLGLPKAVRKDKVTG